MGIVELGHVGIFVNDLEEMERFYTEVVGLTVTDRTERSVFFSARPDTEHHEFVIARGRNTPDDVKLIGQLSWRIDSLDTLIAYHKKFVELGVPIQEEITHGIAYCIYFWDPEGNRCEVYVRNYDAANPIAQPFGAPINLDQDAQGIEDEVWAILEEAGLASKSN